MNMFEYIVVNSDGRQEEIWVCEKCRRKNSDLILEGRWRLIGKSFDGQNVCSMCVGESAVGSEEVPMT